MECIGSLDDLENGVGGLYNIKLPSLPSPLVHPLVSCHSTVLLLAPNLAPYPRLGPGLGQHKSYPRRTSHEISQETDPNSKLQNAKRRVVGGV